MKTEVGVGCLHAKDNLELPAPGRSKDCSLELGEVVTARQHLEFGLLAQHRPFAPLFPLPETRSAHLHQVLVQYHPSQLLLDSPVYVSSSPQQPLLLCFIVSNT